MPNVGKLYGYRDSSANPSLIYSTDSVVDMYSTFYDNTGAKHNNIVVTSIDQDDSFSIGQVNIVNTYISGHTNDGTAEFIYEDTYGRCYTLNNGIYTIIPAGQANKGLYAYYVRWYSKWKIFGNTTFGYRHFYFDWDFTHSVERDVYTFRGMDNNYTFFIRDLSVGTSGTIMDQVSDDWDASTYNNTVAGGFTGTKGEKINTYTFSAWDDTPVILYNNKGYKYYNVGVDSPYTYKGYTYNNNVYYMTRNVSQFKYTQNGYSVQDIYDSTGTLTQFEIAHVSGDCQTIKAVETSTTSVYTATFTRDTTLDTNTIPTA